MAEEPLNVSIPRFKTNEDRFDRLVNGSDSATVETDGGTLPTVAKLLAELRALAIANGMAAYIDTTEGLANTESGQLFAIPSSTDDAALDVYENDAGSAVDTGKKLADGTLGTRTTVLESDVAALKEATGVTDEYLAFVGALADRPPQAVLDVYKNFYAEFVASEVPFDYLMVMRAPDEDTALLNIINPAVSPATNHGTVFTPFVGYKGNGVDQYGNTGWVPDGAGFGFGPASAHIGVWIGDTAEAREALNVVDVGTSLNALAAWSTGASVTVRSRSTVSDVVAAGINSAVGHTLWNRTAAGLFDVYKNGVRVATDVPRTQSGTSDAQPMFWGGRNNGSGVAEVFSPRLYQLIHAGPVLTEDQIALVYPMFLRLLSGLAAFAGEDTPALPGSFLLLEGGEDKGGGASPWGDKRLIYANGDNDAGSPAPTGKVWEVDRATGEVTQWVNEMDIPLSIATSSKNDWRRSFDFAGGRTGTSSATAAVQRIFPESRQCITLPQAMPAALAHGAQVAVPELGRTYYFGGGVNSDFNSPTNAVRRMDWTTDEWTTIAATLQAGLAGLRGVWVPQWRVVVVVGGFVNGGSSGARNYIHIFDPYTETFLDWSPLVFPRVIDSLGIFTMRGYVLVVGGYQWAGSSSTGGDGPGGSGYYNSFWRIDLQARTVTELTSKLLKQQDDFVVDVDPDNPDVAWLLGMMPAGVADNDHASQKQIGKFTWPDTYEVLTS